MWLSIQSDLSESTMKKKSTWLAQIVKYSYTPMYTNVCACTGTGFICIGFELFMRMKEQTHTHIHSIQVQCTLIDHNKTAIYSKYSTNWNIGGARR